MKSPDELARELDVFRGCGDHVYPHDSCPHCLNNGVVMDKIVPAFKAAIVAERDGKAVLHSALIDERARYRTLQEERDRLGADLKYARQSWHDVDATNHRLAGEVERLKGIAAAADDFARCEHATGCLAQCRCGAVEEARQDVIEAAGMLMVDVPAPGTPMARVMLANAAMRRERDQANDQLTEARQREQEDRAAIREADGVFLKDCWCGAEGYPELDGKRIATCPCVWRKKHAPTIQRAVAEDRGR